MGLSIVRAIVEAHLGTVHVMSRVDVGTTFEIALPLEANADRAHPLANVADRTAEPVTVESGDRGHRG